MSATTLQSLQGKTFERNSHLCVYEECMRESFGVMDARGPLLHRIQVADENGTLIEKNAEKAVEALVDQKMEYIRSQKNFVIGRRACLWGRATQNTEKSSTVEKIGLFLANLVTLFTFSPIRDYLRKDELKRIENDYNRVMRLDRGEEEARFREEIKAQKTIDVVNFINSKEIQPSIFSKIADYIRGTSS